MGSSHGPIAVGGLVTSNLVAEYRFDDGTGDVLTDYSGNGHHAQLGFSAGADTNDPAWVTEGLDFDGVDNVVVLPAGVKTPINASNEGTMMFLLKLDNDLPASGSTSLGRFGGGEESHYPLDNGLIYSNVLLSARVNGIDDGAFNKAAWHVLTIRAAPGSGNWKLSQNLNSPIGTATGDADIDLVYFDWLGTGGASYLGGLVAGLLIYDRSLSDAELEQNYDHFAAIGRGISLP